MGEIKFIDSKHKTTLLKLKAFNEKYTRFYFTINTISELIQLCNAIKLGEGNVGEYIKDLIIIKQYDVTGYVFSIKKWKSEHPYSFNLSCVTLYKNSVKNLFDDIITSEEIKEVKVESLSEYKQRLLTTE